MEESTSDWTIDNDFIQSFHLYGWRYDDMYPQGDAPTRDQILCQFEDGKQLKALQRNVQDLITENCLEWTLITHEIRSLRFLFPEPFLNVGKSCWILGPLRAQFLNIVEEKCRLLTDLLQEWKSFQDLVCEIFSLWKLQLRNALVKTFLQHREEVFREHNRLINLSRPKYDQRLRQEKVKNEKEVNREEDESRALLAFFSKQLEVEAKERQRNLMERISNEKEQKIRSDIDKNSSERERNYRKFLEKESYSRERNFRKEIEAKVSALKHELFRRLEEKRRVREGESDEVFQERSKHLDTEISQTIEKSSKMRQRALRDEYLVKWERSKVAMKEDAEKAKGNQTKILDELLEKMLGFRRQEDDEKLRRKLTLKRGDLGKELERRKSEFRADLRRRMEETLESCKVQIICELEVKYSPQFQQLTESSENREDGLDHQDQLEETESLESEITSGAEIEHLQTAARQREPEKTITEEYTYRRIGEFKREIANAVRQLLTLREEQKRLEALKAIALCVRCMRNARNVVIQDCMHLHFCSDCFKQLQQYQTTGKCPTCNNIITGVLIRELLE